MNHPKPLTIITHHPSHPIKPFLTRVTKSPGEQRSQVWSIVHFFTFNLIDLEITQTKVESSAFRALWPFLSPHSQRFSTPRGVHSWKGSPYRGDSCVTPATADVFGSRIEPLHQLAFGPPFIHSSMNTIQ